MDKVRLAIIGIGSMGKRYARLIDDGRVKGLELVCICSRSPETKAWALENLRSGLDVYTSADEMFAAAGSFDALMIVTPHKLHPELAIKAFSLGKHVLCDKPSGVSLLEAEMMNKAARASKKQFGMVFHQRYFHKYLQIKKLITENQLGEIKRVLLEDSKAYRTAWYHQSADWRSSWNGEGGGLLINQGQHVLDIWQWLFGMPKAIYSLIPFGKYNDFLVDDEVTLVMHYPNQMSAAFILSSGEGHCVERLEIVGTKGRLLLEGNTLHQWYFSQDVEVYGRTATVTSRSGLKEEYAVMNFTEEEPLLVKQQLIQNFTDAIRQGIALQVPGEEGIRALELMAGAYLSAWYQKPVQLPVNKEVYKQGLEQKMLEENRIKESTKMKSMNAFAKAHQPEGLCVANLADNIYLSGLRSILKVSREPDIEGMIQEAVAKACNEDGTLKGCEELSEHALSHVAFGKALSYAYELTSEEKYLNAMTALGNQLKNQPRTQTGIFCSDTSRGLSFKELYEVLPFYVEFETKYHRKEQYNDIISQFKGARTEYLRLPEKGAWGKKAWYMMALMDAFSEISEESFEQYKILQSFFKECWGAVKKDFALFQAEADDDVKLIVAYAVLKGCRFEALLSEKHLSYGKQLFAEINQQAITETMTAGLYLKTSSEMLLAAEE